MEKEPQRPVYVRPPLEQRLAQKVADARQIMAAARAMNTQRAYSGDLMGYLRWAAIVGLTALPPTTDGVLAYLVTLVQVGMSPRTVVRHVAGLRSVWDREYGLRHAARAPEVDQFIEGMRRTVQRPLRQAPALTVEDMRLLSRSVEGGLTGAQDRALLLLGFAGGFRRSELAALNVEDVTFLHGAVRVVVRRGKGDQRGQGHVKVIKTGSTYMTCPVRSLRRWLKVSGITTGALFRRIHEERVSEERISGWLVNQRLKHVCEGAGLDPTRYTAHSLRAGCVTTLRSLGVADGVIQRVTGHKDLAQIARYDRGDPSQAVDIGL